MTTHLTRAMPPEPYVGLCGATDGNFMWVKTWADKFQDTGLPSTRSSGPPICEHCLKLQMELHVQGRDVAQELIMSVLAQNAQEDRELLTQARELVDLFQRAIKLGYSITFTPEQLKTLVAICEEGHLIKGT